MIFPNRSQFSSWSLPSKYSAIGLLVGVVSLGITLIAFAQQEAVKPSAAVGEAISTIQDIFEYNSNNKKYQYAQSFSVEDCTVRVARWQWSDEEGTEAIIVEKFSLLDMVVASLQEDHSPSPHGPEVIVRTVTNAVTVSRNGKRVGLSDRVHFEFWDDDQHWEFRTAMATLAGGCLAMKE